MGATTGMHLAATQTAFLAWCYAPASAERIKWAAIDTVRRCKLNAQLERSAKQLQACRIRSRELEVWPVRAAVVSVSNSALSSADNCAWRGLDEAFIAKHGIA